MSLAGNWRLKLLGRPALRWGDGDAVDLPKKAFAVAARLILNRAKCESSRAELGTFLWPESDAVRQQAGLRTLLTRIRRGLRSYSSSPFRIDDDGVALDLEVVDCDLVGVLVRLRRGGAADVVAAIEALKEDLLEGLDGAQTVDPAWIAEQRASLRRLFSRVATTVIERGDLDGQPRVREAVALGIQDGEPNDPDVRRALDKLRRSRGASKGLRASFDEPANDFGAGVDPSGPSAANVPRPEVGPDPRSQERIGAPRLAGGPDSQLPTLLIHVAPFVEMGVSREVAAAFAEDLVVELWRSGVARIVYARDDAMARGIRRDVGFDVYTLSLKARGPESLRISTRLSSAGGAEILWADTASPAAEPYESAIERTSSAVQRRIEDHQIELSAARTDEERSKFVLVAMAEREMLRPNVASVRHARRLLEMALRDGWKSPRALAALGRGFRAEWFLGLQRDATLLEHARSTAREVYQMAPDSSLALRELGAATFFTGDVDTGLFQFAQACELSPLDSRAAAEYAFALLGEGQPRQALEALKTGPKAAVADPYSQWGTALVLFHLGEYRSAIKALSMMPETGAAFRLRAGCEALLGEKDRLPEYKSRFARENPDFSLDDWISRTGLRRREDKERIREAVRLVGF